MLFTKNHPATLVAEVAQELSCHSGKLALAGRDSLSYLNPQTYNFSAEGLKCP